MKLRRLETVRDFTLHRIAPSLQDNHVFDAHWPAQDGTLARLSRHIPDLHDAWKGTVLMMNGETVLGTGEDPRPFFWRGSLCLSSQAYYHGHDFINRVYIVREQRWLTISVPKKMMIGKNWVPFVFDDELHFVHEFSPFRVVKASFMSEHDGFLVLDKRAEHKIKVPKSLDGYWRYRGGSNALQIGQLVVGVGHTNEHSGKTLESIFHRPFLWIYRPGRSVHYYALDASYDPQFRIVDPTSLYQDGNDLILVTCETEKVWNVPDQKGRICRYRLEIEGGVNENCFDLGGGWLHRWSHDESSQIRRLLGAWGRRQGT